MQYLLQLDIIGNVHYKLNIQMIVVKMMNLEREDITKDIERKNIANILNVQYMIENIVQLINNFLNDPKSVMKVYIVDV